MAHNQGNYDNAANAPYWAVNSAICKAAPGRTHSRPNAANVAYLYGNTAPSAYITDETVGLFMVDSAEEHAGSDQVVDISIIQGGSGYVEAPGVSFSGGGGSGAAATATISGGVVTKILVTNTGSSYETVPTVNINVPRLTIPTANVNTSTDIITYTAHGLSTGEALHYYSNGGSAITGLTNDTVYYANVASSSTFTLYDTKPHAVTGGATGKKDLSGTGNNAQYFDKADQTTATAIADKGLGQGGGSDSGWTHTPHTGWNLKKVGTGGRAGRVQWETLSVVADVQSDGSDDITLPDA